MGPTSSNLNQGQGGMRIWEGLRWIRLVGLTPDLSPQGSFRLRAFAPGTPGIQPTGQEPKVVDLRGQLRQTSRNRPGDVIQAGLGGGNSEDSRSISVRL